MIKRLNIKNVVIGLVVLVTAHFVTGLLVSPMLGKFIIERINQNSSAKVYVERVNIWPLTVSFSLRNVKVFDSRNTDNKIAEFKLVSVRASLLGLLSKRLAAEVKISGANINLEGEPDGTFNIQQQSLPKISGKTVEPAGILESSIKNKDWFIKGYDLVKKKFSSDALKKEKALGLEAKKITKAIVALPKGRRVHFKSGESYLLQITKLLIVDACVNLKNHDGRFVQIEDARIEVNNAAFDPELGFRLGGAEIAGKIKNAELSAGSLKITYAGIPGKDGRKEQFNFGLREVNLDALRFIYEDSLPVEIVRGMVDITSETLFDNGNINSINQISLSNHELKPKGSQEFADISVPLPLLCEALNNINPVRLDFTISGTVEKPQFKDFTRSLMNMVKPNLKNIGRMIKSEVLSKGIAGILEAVSGKKEDNTRSAPGEADKEKTSAQSVVDSLQSIFGNTK